MPCLRFHLTTRDQDYSGVRLIRRTNQPLPCPAAGSDFTHDAIGLIFGLCLTHVQPEGGTELEASPREVRPLPEPAPLIPAGVQPSPAASGFFCSRKKRSISRLASGPRGSV